MSPEIRPEMRAPGRCGVAARCKTTETIWDDPGFSTLVFRSAEPNVNDFSVYPSGRFSTVARYSVLVTLTLPALRGASIGGLSVRANRRTGNRPPSKMGILP